MKRANLGIQRLAHARERHRASMRRFQSFLDTSFEEQKVRRKPRLNASGRKLAVSRKTHKREMRACFLFDASKLCGPSAARSSGGIPPGRPGNPPRPPERPPLPPTPSAGMDQWNNGTMDRPSLHLYAPRDERQPLTHLSIAAPVLFSEYVNWGSMLQRRATDQMVVLETTAP